MKNTKTVFIVKCNYTLIKECLCGAEFEFKNIDSALFFIKDAIVITPAFSFEIQQVQKLKTSSKPRQSK